MLVFGGLNLAAVALFVICFTLAPFLAVKPTKFAILYVLHFFIDLIPQFTAKLLWTKSWALLAVTHGTDPLQPTELQGRRWCEHTIMNIYLPRIACNNYHYAGSLVTLNKQYRTLDGPSASTKVPHLTASNPNHKRWCGVHEAAATGRSCTFSICPLSTPPSMDAAPTSLVLDP